MDIDSSSPQQPAPRQPQPGMPPRPMQPISRRPAVDGFAPRRPMPSGNNTPSRPAMGQSPRPMDVRAVSKPVVTPQQTTVPATSALPPSQRPQPFTTRPLHTGMGSARTAETTDRRDASTSTPTQSTEDTHAQREHSNTGHAGLVGFIAFIVLCILFLLPLIPGKIIDNLPLASSTLSTGNQSLDCIGAQGQTRNSTVYDSKAGTPLTYTYSTSTTQTATCDGQSQSAVVERTSQFSPIALVLDLLLAVIVAAITARIWRIVYTRKHHSSHPKTSHTKR